MIIRILQEINRVLKESGRFLLIENALTRSQFNLLGKLVHSYDLGTKIRPPERYIPILEKEFTLDEYYPMRSGVMDYSVFILRKKQSLLDIELEKSQYRSFL